MILSLDFSSPWIPTHLTKIHNVSVYLHNSGLSEKQCQKKSPTDHRYKSNKILGNTFTQGGEGFLHKKNVEYLVKESGRDMSKWNAILYSQNGKKSIVKMSFLPKMVYRYNTISFKMSTKKKKKNS